MGPGVDGIHFNASCEHAAVAVHDVAAARRNLDDVLLMLCRLFDVTLGPDDLKEVETRTNPNAPERHDSDQNTDALLR